MIKDKGFFTIYSKPCELSLLMTLEVLATKLEQLNRQVMNYIRYRKCFHDHTAQPFRQKGSTTFFGKKNVIWSWNCTGKISVRES